MVRQHRWLAVLTYRTEAGLIDVQHDIDELHELQDLVERGADWNALVDIHITLQTPVFEEATLEEMSQVAQMTQAQFVQHLKERRRAH